MARKPAQTAEEIESLYLADGDGEAPSKRIRALVRKLHEGLSRIAELEDAAEAATSSSESALAAARTEAAATAKAAADADWTTRKATWDDDLALARLGIVDEDAAHLLRRDHARLPEADRPSLADYAAKLRDDPEARKGKSAALLAGLGIAASNGGTTTQPPPKGGVTSGGSKQGEVTEADIRAAYAAEATKPGTVAALFARMG